MIGERKKISKERNDQNIFCKFICKINEKKKLRKEKNSSEVELKRKM